MRRPAGAFGGVTSVKSSSGRLMLPLIGCDPVTPEPPMARQSLPVTRPE
jgi:hypothetical protein